MKKIIILLMLFWSSVASSQQFGQWSTPSYVPPTSSGYYKIKAVNASYGWASNDGQLMKTSDGGKTWTPLSNAPAQVFTALEIIDTLNGWFGFGDNIYHTTNGGTSWTSQSAVFNGAVEAIKFVDVNTGWAVGSCTRGSIIRRMVGRRGNYSTILPMLFT